MISCSIQIEKIENGFIVSVAASGCYPPKREFYVSREELEADSSGLVKLALDRAAEYQKEYQNSALGAPTTNPL